MEPLAILRADPLDLLFENRNKMYGAYTLRKFYDRRLYTSIGITFSVVALISFFLYLNFTSLPTYVKPPATIDILLDNFSVEKPPPKPIVPQARTASIKPPAAIQFIVPTITAQNPPTPMATIEDLNLNAIGDKTITGPPDEGQKNNNTQAAIGSGLTPAVEESKPEVYGWTEIMPEFPGGIEALKRFLLKNLRMPDSGLEEGMQIKVIARFIVGADGKVRDIEITHPADPVFNAEVKRVILKMPDWKPGVQNHRIVAVYFSLPVNFVSAE